MKLVVAVLAGVTLSVSVPGNAIAQMDAAISRKAGLGIWKSAVPPVDMKGEFDGHDPIGLANNQFIKVDCSINWTDPDDGKLYCFNSPTSFGYFQEWPKKHGRRAREVWERRTFTQ